MVASVKTRKEFGRLVDGAITDYDLDKKAIAADVGIGLTTVYRICRGETRIDKPTIAALVRSINRQAGKHVLEENRAMTTAGYKLNGYARDATEAQDKISDLIAAHAAHLPEAVQEDLLTMVRALEKKHAASPRRAAVGK